MSIDFVLQSFMEIVFVLKTLINVFFVKVCDPHHSLQPENQPIFQPISERSNMEAR